MSTLAPRLSLRAYGPAHGSHRHEHFQVLVGIEGTLELDIEGRGLRVGPGEGVVVAPGAQHDFESRGGSRCLVLDDGEPLWAQCAARPAQPQQVRALTLYLAQALQAGRPLAALHGPSLLLEAWRPAAMPLRPRRAIDWPALALWVQSRLDRPVTVAELAARACLGTSQLALRCHEANGMGPLEWLRLQRLARARQLREGGMPVKEVARRTGYRSPSALTAALRRKGL
jgi:AraC-like DNA-binding protein